MTTPVRRALVFLGMVGSGLLLIGLFSDDSRSPRRGPQFGRAADTGGAVQLVDRDRTETKVTLGEVDFDILKTVEVEPGRFEQRPAYVVRIKEGRPGPDGQFLVDEPTISFLDELTGDIRGELSADTGEFMTSGSVGGRFRFDMADVEPDSFSLSGRVRGEFPDEAGRVAHLEAERLEVDGEHILGPGEVSWWRDDVRLTGIDMTWDGEAGRVRFARDARLVLTGSVDRAAATVQSAGGLTWHLDGPSGGGYGEMHGPVIGDTTDGSHLEGDTLTLSAESRALILSGSASFEARRDDAKWKVTAESITVSETVAGKLDLARAEGGVRIHETSADGVPGWMDADSITIVGDLLDAPGTVTWSRQGVVCTGEDLRWNRATGELSYGRDAVWETSADATTALAGARLEAAGGMRWTIPPRGVGAEHGSGRMLGPIRGNLPDGGRLVCDELAFDGSEGTLTLLGDVTVSQELAGARRELDAQQITLHLDEAGQLVLAECDLGAQLVVHDEDGALPVTLKAEHLGVLHGSVRSEGFVTCRRGELIVEGVGLFLDQEEGRLDIAQSARITFAGGLRSSLESDLGLTWWFGSDGPGRGELQGPVRGHTSDGQRLAADSAVIDEDGALWTLRGDTVLAWPPDGELRSQQLSIRSRQGRLWVRSDVEVHWTRGGMSGRGVGLALDESAGTMHIERDVRLDLLEPDGTLRLSFETDGSLSWTAPVDSDRPAQEGRGELRGDVVGRDAHGTRLETELVEIDGPTGLVELVGPSRLLREEGAATLSIDARDRIELERDEAGLAVRARALGAVRGLRLDGGERLELRTEDLLAHREAGTISLRGASSLARRNGDRVTLVEVPAVGSILATTVADRLSSIEADGRVRCIANRLEALCDRMTWDLRADHLLADGDCRFNAGVAWLHAPRVEIWPEAQRWLVPPAEIGVHDRR